MKLGLLGFPIDHSLSPSIYKRLLGSDLTSYDLFSYEKPDHVPNLEFFASKLDGLNITSPYKKHFIKNISLPSPLVKTLGIVNVLAFKNGEVTGTNTDLLAVVEILLNYKRDYPKLQILLLGDGSMAEVTKIVANDLGIPYFQFSRRLTPGFENLNLKSYSKKDTQNLIINSCSRNYVFNGQVLGDEIFWDYNYSFLPHQNILPQLVKSYVDGQTMLELQAKEAIKFWREVNPKLK